jgi:HlyD family secretion protein
MAGACRSTEDPAVQIQTAPAERRDIIVDAEATGVVEPINVIEVKSKASGLITQMSVETGTEVKPGDLLVQVDTRDVKNQYDQSLADLKAAEARVEVVSAQRKRSDELFAQRIITAQEHEATTLDFANAQAQLVRSRASLDLAQQRLDDATVRAPVAGTIIEKTVSIGQVITSATGAFGGGTTLLKMADLGKVRVRALVNETDIGNVRAGLAATVTVDAYPERPFRGQVEKIEPQAVVEQSVTMFPVLVSIANEEGLLKPGMNGEVSILIDQRDGVISVPNDAVRSPREAALAAAALGLDPQEVARQLQSSMGARGGRNGGGGAGGAAGARPVRVQSQGDVAMDPPQRGGQRQGPPATQAQCDSVTAAFAKHPEAQKQLDKLREDARAGTMDRTQLRDKSAAIYSTLGVESRLVFACRSRNGGDGAQRSGAGGEQRGSRGASRQGGSGPSVQLGAGEAPVPSSRSRAGLVFVADSAGFVPRLVRLGVSNYDYTEIVSGLEEGEQVALLAAATLQQRREANVERFQRMTGGGVPGMSRQESTGGGGQRGGGSRR